VALVARVFGAVLKLSPALNRDVTVHRDVAVAAADGTPLLADLYQARTQDPQPTVLIRSPYGRRGYHGLAARMFAERGYHVLVQSTRGTSGSGGTIDFDAEAGDGRATADWITGQPWSNGELGTFGSSYLSFTQYALASTRPPQLKAMAIAVWGADRRAGYYPGGSFALDRAPISSFVDAVKALRPTGIIGVSAVPKLFTREVITAMAEINERPIIFPYSNPTSRSECSAEEAYRWSDGRAVFASGSPFPPVEIAGRHFVPGQGNNVYIFPAMGMAIYATEATRVTDEMFIEAGQAVADQVPADLLNQGLLYPLQSNILETEIQTAARVAMLVFNSGLARVSRPTDFVSFIREHVYKPEYPAVETVGATKLEPIRTVKPAKSA